MASSAWKIKVGVDLDTSEIDAKLGQYDGKKIKMDVDVGGQKEAKKASDTIKDAGLSYQQYRLILDKAVDAVKSMTGQTLKLNDAQTEFKKVSDLSGEALNNYTQKLAKMGKQVGRSG